VGIEYKSTTTSAYEKATSSTYKKKPLKKYIEFNNVGSVRLWNYIERKKKGKNYYPLCIVFYPNGT
jgi:hypothetical protein